MYMYIHVSDWLYHVTLHDQQITKKRVSGNGGRCLNAVVGAVQNVGCSATISLLLLVYLIAGRM